MFQYSFITSLELSIIECLLILNLDTLQDFIYFDIKISFSYL